METIVSLITPPMKGAIAVIRMSGDETFDIISSCFSKSINRERKDVLFGNFIDTDGKTISGGQCGSAGEDKWC